MPLAEKVKWAWGEYKQAAETALLDLTLQPGELFTLTEAWYDDNEKDEEYSFNAPYLNFDNVIAHIRAEITECEEENVEWYNYQWYELDKWVPVEERQLKREYTYTLVGDQVWYFNKREDRDYSYWVDPNLPVPYHVGDILTIDCRPFAPLKHALLIKCGDNHDCCCLQGLCKDEVTSLWTTGAVKHRSLFGFGIDPIYTPIYRLSRYAGELPEEEKVLLAVQKKMGYSEQNGRKLWDCIHGYSKPRIKRRTDGLKDEQLKRLVEKCFINES